MIYAKYYTMILCDFQQNETAIDVARRKEHPEIIIIITAQPTKVIIITTR